MTKYLERAHWQDAGNLLLGAWLLFSPWLLGYTGEAAAATNAYIVGAAIALIAAGALYAYQKWEEWLNVALAIWLVISPWVLGFSAMAAVMYNAVVIGLLVLALAFWAAMTEPEAGRRTTA